MTFATCGFLPSLENLTLRGGSVSRIVLPWQQPATRYRLNFGTSILEYHLVPQIIALSLCS